MSLSSSRLKHENMDLMYMHLPVLSAAAIDTANPYTYKYTSICIHTHLKYRTSETEINTNGGTPGKMGFA